MDNQGQYIEKHHSVLQELRGKAISMIHDTETIARIQGIAIHIQTFDLLVGLVLEEVLLWHTDNLSRTLQRKEFSALEEQLVSIKTKTTLAGLGNEINFYGFWVNSNQNAKDLDAINAVNF